MSEHKSHVNVIARARAHLRKNQIDFCYQSIIGDLFYGTHTHTRARQMPKRVCYALFVATTSAAMTDDYVVMHTEGVETACEIRLNYKSMLAEYCVF